LKSYETMDALMAKIRKLMWHDHEGRLVTTIRFNFNAYAKWLEIFLSRRLSGLSRA